MAKHGDDKASLLFRYCEGWRINSLLPMFLMQLHFYMILKLDLYGICE